MRLTAELIQSSLSYINPLRERELDLRGHKLPAIENLGVAGDQECIDFTDNDISSISNFPLSPRLRTLLLARNRITHIQPSLAKQIPGLTTLVLTQNNIPELADLEPLRHFSKLTHLCIAENPVTRKEHYRFWVIWLVPTVRFFDYQKVKDAERGRAAELFGTLEEATDLAKKILGAKSRVFDPSAIEGGRGTGPTERPIRVKLTPKERKRAEKLIREAKDLQTITRLERDLNEGRVPGGIDGYEDDDESDEGVDDGKDDDTKMS
ncbi:U2 snRNP complex subunit [Ascosphaera aggregata]|nr:U2 snRNP complex subunit [Ascosphaera aggregata]